MSQSMLWEQETILHTVLDITPQLASWDMSTHPSQIRLRNYLDDLMTKLLPLSSDDHPLFRIWI